MSKSKYLSLILAGAILGCNDEVAGNRPENLPKSYLISADSVSSIPYEMLKSFAQYAGHASISDLVRYGVDTYKIVYETNYNGRPIQASGLLYIPQGMKEPAPLVSLQHGTTFLKNKAPSATGDITGMEYFASAGYVAVMPDYIGYGTSAEVFHPYYDEVHSASAVVDMIKSAKEFLQNKAIAFNDQLFLAGYSEGGYVTLAAARAIEEDARHGMKITAIAAGAGGYDLREMLKTVTTKSYYSYPAYLAFVIMSYNETYGWKRPLSYYFQDKYARALETYMNGEYDGWQINSRLTTDIKSLLNPQFHERLKSADGEPEFKKALTDNSISGWPTNTPTRLYHGTRDEIIPYENSETTLVNFQSAGASDVSLTAIPGGSHGSAFVPMLQKLVPWFETLRQK